MNVEMQNGVIRSNCVDSLDRTNTFQYLIGEVALIMQLDKINRTEFQYSNFKMNPQLQKEYRWVIYSIIIRDV